MWHGGAAAAEGRSQSVYIQVDSNFVDQPVANSCFSLVAIAVIIMIGRPGQEGKGLKQAMLQSGCPSPASVALDKAS